MKKIVSGLLGVLLVCGSFSLAAGDNNQEKAVDKTVISALQVKHIVSDSIIKWKKSARYLIIEYSDLQCPYCQRLRNSNTLNTVIKKYKWRVSKTLRHYPLGFHKLALPAAIATECAKEQGRSNYFAYIGGVYAKWLSSEQVLTDVAKDLGLDETKWKQCLISDKIEKRVLEQMSEGKSLFGITGTPWNVILDLKTGEYKIVSGAQPLSAFQKVLDGFIKNNK